MLHYPIGAVCYELFNIAAGSLIRSADDDAHLGTDFYGKVFLELLIISIFISDLLMGVFMYVLLRNVFI